MCSPCNAPLPLIIILLLITDSLDQNLLTDEAGSVIQKKGTLPFLIKQNPEPPKFGTGGRRCSMRGWRASSSSILPLRCHVLWRSWAVTFLGASPKETLWLTLNLKHLFPSQKAVEIPFSSHNGADLDPQSFFSPLALGMMQDGRGNPGGSVPTIGCLLPSQGRCFSQC